MTTSPKSADPDMEEHWEAHAQIWDRDEQARDFADQALASLLEHVDLHHQDWKRRRVLDFGCGTGLLTEKLAPLVREVVAVDTSAAMLAVLRDKQIANVHVVCADVDEDSVRSDAPWFGDFDLIVASSVCGLLTRYEQTLGVLAAALNPSGFFVQWDWMLLDGDVDEDGLTMESVATAFAKAGLTRKVVERTFDVLFDADTSPVLMGVASKTVLTIRLVVGGNAILEAGDARVLVYANSDCDPVEIILPPRTRWQACVADDFAFTYDAVMAAIREAGFRPVVSPDAAVSSSSARAGR